MLTNLDTNNSILRTLNTIAFDYLSTSLFHDLIFAIEEPLIIVTPNILMKRELEDNYNVYAY